MTVDQLVNRFRPGLETEKYGLNCRLSFFYHHLRTSSTALDSSMGARNIFEPICRVVSGEKLVHCTERSSFAFHLPFFDERLGLERKLVAASWHSVMATERHRF